MLLEAADPLSEAAPSSVTERESTEVVPSVAGDAGVSDGEGLAAKGDEVRGTVVGPEAGLTVVDAAGFATSCSRLPSLPGNCT